MSTRTSANTRDHTGSSSGAGGGGLKLSVKFLLSNTLAGSLIGTGGVAIKELIEVSEARVTVSSVQDVYPGTSERIVLISGSESAVNTAQILVWEMIALNVNSNGDKSVSWSPRAATENPGDLGEVPVTGRIAIPAAAGGLILGRQGATIRAISEETGARVQMTSKEEAFFTQERILTISGGTDSCVKCVTLILFKLSEDLEAAQYVNRGVTYSSHAAAGGGGMGMPLGLDGRNPGGSGRGRRGAPGQANTAAAAVIPTVPPAVYNTQIQITVDDSIVGNILGRQGSTLREIMSLSGARITVSPRGEYEEGTTNRIVTIVGSPASTQTAHLYVQQKLNQLPPSRPPRRAKQNDA